MRNLFTLLLCFLFFVSNAQESVESNSDKPKGITNLNNNNRNRQNQLLINQIETMSISQSQLNNFANNTSNTVVIQQIGDGNSAVSNRNSQTSSISYFQNGNANVIESISFIPNTTENLIQNGNNNRLTNFSFGNVESTSLQVLQNGNNQSFQKFGSNNLTNTMTFRITGDNQTVIVRSFQ